MFNRRPDIDMSQIVPTSKMSLKMSCLAACKSNIAEAAKLYEYMSADLKGLPDIDPAKPSVFSQVMSGADSVVGWIGQHQQDIIQGIGMIQSLRQGAAVGGSAAAAASSIPAGVPPIPNSL